MQLAKLQAFRQEAYEYLGKARDATFELTDAILLTRNAYSLADLSLSPVFRRQWSSAYEALQDTRPQRRNLMQLYIQQIPTVVRPLLAGDHTAWARQEAVILKERTIEHQPNQCERWSDLMPLLSWELWLARSSCYRQSFTLAKVSTQANFMGESFNL